MQLIELFAIAALPIQRLHFNTLHRSRKYTPQESNIDVNAGKKSLVDESGAKSGAMDQSADPLERLGRLADAWPNLDPAIRKSILSLAKC